MFVVCYLSGMYLQQDRLQLDAVGAYVLDGCRAHCARNQCQVFQPVISLLQAPLHQFVPVLPGCYPQGDTTGAPFKYLDTACFLP